MVQLAADRGASWPIRPGPHCPVGLSVAAAAEPGAAHGVAQDRGPGGLVVNGPAAAAAVATRATARDHHRGPAPLQHSAHHRASRIMAATPRELSPRATAGGRLPRGDDPFRPAARRAQHRPAVRRPHACAVAAVLTTERAGGDAAAPDQTLSAGARWCWRSGRPAPGRTPTRPGRPAGPGPAAARSVVMIRPDRLRMTRPPSDLPAAGRTVTADSHPLGAGTRRATPGGCGPAHGVAGGTGRGQHGLRAPGAAQHHLGIRVAREHRS
jgi:hypothetical protein